MRNAVLNDAQMRILRMFSFARTKKQSDELCRELANFYATKAENELEILWKSGKITAAKNEKFAKSHFRTPYL